jgi:hypothetical protein
MRYRTVAVSLAGNLIVSSTRVEKVADKDAVWKPCAAVCRPTGSLRQIEPQRSEDGHRDTDRLPPDPVSAAGTVRGAEFETVPAQGRDKGVHGTRASFPAFTYGRVDRIS